MINVCVPVIKRYDLLEELLSSLELSTLPVSVHVIDNGKQDERMRKALKAFRGAQSSVFTPNKPMGVAESWNWFIRNTSEERVISNDDIIFSAGSLEKLVAPNHADLVWGGFGFSCFVIRDSCVKLLGMFDETISPGYAYYEDDDYLQRLDGRGTREPSATAVNVDADLRHHRSATLETATGLEMMEHHRRFKIAQSNYMRKWGLATI